MYSTACICLILETSNKRTRRFTITYFSLVSSLVFLFICLFEIACASLTTPRLLQSLIISLFQSLENKKDYILQQAL